MKQKIQIKKTARSGLENNVYPISGEVTFRAMNYDPRLESYIYKRLREWMLQHPEYTPSLQSCYDAVVERSHSGMQITCIIRVFFSGTSYKEMAKSPFANQAVENCIRKLNSHTPNMRFIDFSQAVTA